MTYTLTGNEIVYVSGVDGAGRPSPAQLPLPASQFATSATPSQYQTNTATSATTLTATNIAGSSTAANPEEVYLNMTGTLGAGAALTLPTVASLVAAFPSPVVGQTYILRIINSSSGAFSWTVTTNTGWTLNGTMTIAQNTWREFLITLTSLTAATAQTVGTGTFS